MSSSHGCGDSALSYGNDMESLAAPSDGPTREQSADHNSDEIVALQQQISALQTEVAALRAAVEASTMMPGAAPDTPGANTAIFLTGHHEEGGSTQTMTSRRDLLRFGGIGAVAVLAASGAAAATTSPARAADGANLVLGSSVNTAEHATALTYNGSETAPTALSVDVSARANSTGLKATAGSPLTSSFSSIGVLGAAGDGATAYGVSGAGGSDANGVYGFAQNSSSFGVWGETDSGWGVVGQSNTGIDLAASGTGRLFQALSGAIGAPTAGTYLTGEQIRDNRGDLYLCAFGGTPGSWNKVASLSTHYTGGALGFLSTPIRVYDSRVTGGSLVGNAARNIQITNVTIANVTVPQGATGCIGNLTVTNTTASGYLVIYPEGSATPTTSTVNFLTGQTAANSFVVGVSSGGQVTVHSFIQGRCDFIIDITGFVM